MSGLTLVVVPFGRRLWLAVVIIFLYLLYEQPPWLLYVEHPFEYPLQLLTVLGQILFIDLCIDWPISFVASGLQAFLRHRQDRDRSQVFIAIEHRRDLIGAVLPLFGVWAFLAAVFFAPGMRLPWWAALAGWLAYLMVLLAEFVQGQPLTTYQLAEIEASEDAELVFFSVQTEREILGTSLQTDWQGATGYLIANGWEMFEVHQVDRKKGGRPCWQRTARFRRALPVSPTFSIWHGSVQHYRLGFG